MKYGQVCLDKSMGLGKHGHANRQNIYIYIYIYIYCQKSKVVTFVSCNLRFVLYTYELAFQK